MSNLSRLGAGLQRIAANYSGKCAYALTDLAASEHLAFNQGEVMPTASLLKVPVLVALYQAIAEGRTGLQDRIQYREDQRCLGSGVLVHMTPGAEMTVRDAAALMIVISDNIATNMVIDLVGLERINKTMSDLGLEKTVLLRRLGDRGIGTDARNMAVSTPEEMSRLLELIARHEAVSPEASEDMLRIMRRQDYRHELSGRLPWNELNRLDNHKENWVAEKGGAFLNGVRTSGAIFHSPRATFVLSAFCEGGTGPGTGRDAEGNHTLRELGYAAWKELAAP